MRVCFLLILLTNSFTINAQFTFLVKKILLNSAVADKIFHKFLVSNTTKIFALSALFQHFSAFVFWDFRQF